MSDPTAPYKVLISVRGGPGIGMGHVNRSVQLARELASHPGVVVGFECDDDPISLEKIRAEGLFSCDGAHRPDELEARVVRDGMHCVVFDRPGEIQPYTSILRQRFPGLWMVGLDYFNFDQSDLDVIVNLLNHNFRQSRPSSEKVLYFEGAEFGMFRPGFDELIARPKTITPELRDVVITFGGSDPGRNTLRVLEALCSSDAIGRVHVIIGANFVHADEVRMVARSVGERVHVYEDLRDPECVMFRSDLAFSGAGTTICELAALGVPTVVIAQSPEEVRFAQVFERNGAARCLGLSSQVTVEMIGGELKRLARDESGRAAMSAAGRRMVDGRGRKRVAALVLQGRREFPAG